MQDQTRATHPVVDIAIPVYNEERDLETSVRTLHAYLAAHSALVARITIVDNASTDSTPAIGMRLARDLDGVRFVHLDEKGRGRALRTAWLDSDAEIVAYMDVDLSTRLDALSPLLGPIVEGRADITIGSRLTTGAHVTRGLKRECVSRGYNLLLRIVLHARYRDAQCGFKAVRTGVARELLPMVRDQGWFFDTELLTLAQRFGMRIAEVPVTWIEDTDSRVDIASTAMTDLRGVARMVRDARRTRATSLADSQRSPRNLSPPLQGSSPP
jgi:glycosyltransferase involved in cell wall biosynthesis